MWERWGSYINSIIFFMDYVQSISAIMLIFLFLSLKDWFILMNGSSSQVMYHEWVLGPGGNLQKARAETESSMLAEWRHAMGDSCQGREGDWVLGKTKLEGCLKCRLSQSSEEFRKMEWSSKRRRGMWFFIMPPWKRRAVLGKSHHLQQQQRAFPSPHLHHLSVSEVVPYPADEWPVDNLPSWSTHVEQGLPHLALE